jgi:hypothetical protein
MENQTDDYFELKREDYVKYLEISGFSAMSFIIGCILARFCLR